MILFWISVVLALAGIGYLLASARNIRRFSKAIRASHMLASPVPVSLLKPLHGAEPRLAANLASFFDQQWDAPVQIVAGVGDDRDQAIPALQALTTAPPRRDATLVVSPRRHGANAKISNLINMMPMAQHDIIILSDSDIAVPPDYLRRVAGALAQPGVGAVTCVYAGRGDAGFWSRLAAANLSYFFLPDVLTSVALDTGGACMGSTIGLRRETLERIGGFSAFADVLADDHAIGAAVRALGLTVAVAPVVVTHASTDASCAALVRHELRWAATVRELGTARYVGLAMTMPLPFALLAAAIRPDLATAALIALALMARLLSARTIDRLVGCRTAAWWILPPRELLRFAIFVAGFFVRKVDWRGEKLNMLGAGRIGHTVRAS
ncbi:bacteriohopanetetrol glucosamine biosynthesis glycosyltransferase HpnI [Sphingomonas sp. 28-63-12]|uniref:bacteriohopanetetrol glucosamine biosynthesis glycosyltransferase HpnI n=1 Tax=Sphingomonas sp. 28-63-12 TaxID=1970434 RepID=UPI0035A8493E